MNMNKLWSENPAPGRQIDMSSSDSTWWATIPATVRIPGMPHANAWHNEEKEDDDLWMDDVDTDEEVVKAVHQENAITVHHVEIALPKKYTSK